MRMVVSVQFRDSSKAYFFDPGDFVLELGTLVIVETVRGLELGRVVGEQREITESEIVGELKPVIRLVEEADLERLKLLQARHKEVLAVCNQKIKEHSLPMHLVRAEYSFDGSRLTFYFTAAERVDFRLLVRDLARAFRSRIELRQIGPRDEAKLLGGLGSCGRTFCCASFLPDYAHVTVKMAKEQDLPLNPARISGVCGRLLCCLSYEHQQYVELKPTLPRRGMRVQTPDGVGEVIGMNVLQQMVTVQLSGSEMIEHYPVAQLEEVGGKGEKAPSPKGKESDLLEQTTDLSLEDAAWEGNGGHRIDSKASSSPVQRLPSATSEARPPAKRPQLSPNGHSPKSAPNPSAGTSKKKAPSPPNKPPLPRPRKPKNSPEENDPPAS